jgi:hypothetical protein
LQNFCTKNSNLADAILFLGLFLFQGQFYKTFIWDNEALSPTRWQYQSQV